MKNIKFLSAWYFIITALLFFNGCFFNNSPSSRGESAFREFIASPIPKGVNVEEGDAMGFQGYYTYVIFTAEPTVFKELVKEYEFLPNCCIKEVMYADEEPREVCRDVKYGIGRSAKKALVIMKDTKCYYRKNMAENAKGIRGTFYMFYDNETRKAVFQGSF